MAFTQSHPEPQELYWHQSNHASLRPQAQRPHFAPDPNFGSDWSSPVPLGPSPTIGAIPKRRGSIQTRHPPGLKRPRLEPHYAPSACLRCRRKDRYECDRVLPTCGRCDMDGFICQYYKHEAVENAAKTALQDAMGGVGHESCQTSFSTSMEDSGVQFNTTMEDVSSQTKANPSGIKTADVGTNTSTQVCDRAVQTRIATDGKLSMTEWCDLVASVRTLHDRQIEKGAKWLPCSTDFIGEYQQRLEAATAGAAELVRGMIDLYERATKNSK